MKRFLLVVVVGVLVMSSCTSNQVGNTDSGSFVFVSPGGKLDFFYPEAERKTIGDFAGPSVMDSSQTIRLSDFPETALVLNFWGSWCGPCRAEAEDLNVAAELSAGKPVQFLGVNVQDSRESAADFITSKQVGFPSIFDPTMRTLLSMQGFPTVGLPFTIMLDREHRVAQIFLRPVGAQELDEALSVVLATQLNPGESSERAPDPANSAPSAAATPER